MLRRWTTSSLLSVLALTAVSAPADDKPAPQKPIFAPIVAEVRNAPTSFRAQGKTHLVYELAVTNFGKTPCVLDRIGVFDQSGKQLATFEGSQLGDALLRIADPGEKAAAEKQKLRAGEMTVFYAWVTVPGTAPTKLAHELTVRVGDYPEGFVIKGAATPVSSKIHVIASPLRGENWLAANGPSNTSGHRRVVIPLDGSARIPQRFATDWVQIGDDGKTKTGDEKDNKNYHCYGKEAFAVADGVVSATKDGIPENVPGINSRAVPITLETVAGNHVIIDIGGSVYGFYAHLQPGSLRVKVGDKVRKGQVIGLVGNSGNSTEPHLHFHLIDRNSPLGGEGVPFELPAFQVQGTLAFGEDDQPKTAWKPLAKPEDRQNEIPLADEVIRFVQIR